MSQIDVCNTLKVFFFLFLIHLYSIFDIHAGNFEADFIKYIQTERNWSRFYHQHLCALWVFICPTFSSCQYTFSLFFNSCPCIVSSTCLNLSTPITTLCHSHHSYQQQRQQHYYYYYHRHHHHYCYWLLLMRERNKRNLYYMRPQTVNTLQIITNTQLHENTEKLLM